MTEDASPSTPIRQWKVLLTEDSDHHVQHALLAWRSFPCAASHWDGQRWFTFPPASTAPITSVDALRGALADIAVGEWVEGRLPRYLRP